MFTSAELFFTNGLTCSHVALLFRYLREGREFLPHLKSTTSLEDNCVDLEI